MHIFVFFSLLLSFSVNAQSPSEAEAMLNSTSTVEPKVNFVKGRKQIKIVYGSPLWNQDSRQSDSAFIFIRDKNSGKIAKIILDETAPDSSTFSGSFSLGWASVEKTHPEVYIPPQNLRGVDGMKKFKSMLVQGKLPRKPVVFRVDEEDGRVFEVYDTKDQAKKAWEAQKQAQKLRLQQRDAEKLLKKAQADNATIDTANMAAKAAQMKAMELEAAKREMDRVRMEQLERKKAEELREKQDQMNAAEKKRRAAEAKKLAEEAFEHYKKSEFDKAEPLFKKAVDLDPTNTDIYLKYGITQYRLEKFNEALVTMKIAPETKETTLEKAYYMGLIHFRLREMQSAIEKFQLVKKSSDPVMGPSAAFYEGMVYFAIEKWDESQAAFEHVLDTSKDPRLDSKAEGYIEKIAAIKAWEAKKKKPFTLIGMLSAQYDSNVLSSPDGIASQGSAAKEADIRGVVMAMLQYRAIYERAHEWTPQAMTYYQRSSKDAVSSADAFLNNLSLPYTYKGKALGKGYKFTAKPGYEVLNMDANSDGTREVVMNSIVANFDNTFVMSKKWIQSVIFETRMDDSQLPSSTGDADSDSMKYTLKSKHINFLNDKRKKILQSYLGLIFNDASGKDKNYQRIDLGATFLKPIHWHKFNWSFTLAIYRLNYPDATTKRTDLNVTLTTGLSRPLNDWLNWGITASYANNNSDVSTNQYNKYTVTTNLTSKTTF